LVSAEAMKPGTFSYVDFNEYAATVANHLQHSFGILDDRVKINIDTGDVIISVDNISRVNIK
jgi:hypothetical protein